MAKKIPTCKYCGGLKVQASQDGKGYICVVDCKSEKGRRS